MSENEAVSCEVQMHFGSFDLAKDIRKVVITIFPSTNEAACREVQTHFGSFRLSSFIKKVVGAISRFMRPKLNLFAVKFRRILEVFSVQAL